MNVRFPNKVAPILSIMIVKKNSIIEMKTYCFPSPCQHVMVMHDESLSMNVSIVTHHCGPCHGKSQSPCVLYGVSCAFFGLGFGHGVFMHCIAKLVDSCIGEICVMGLLWNMLEFLEPHLSLAIRQCESIHSFPSVSIRLVIMISICILSLALWFEYL